MALVAGLVVLIGGAALVSVRVATAADDTVPAGVTIDGIEVGGLTADQARRAVLAAATPPKGTVTVERQGDSDFPQRVTYARLAPQPEVDAAVRDAITNPSLFGRVRAQLGLESGRDVPLDWTAAPEQARTVAARVARDVDTKGRPATVSVSPAT